MAAAILFFAVLFGLVGWNKSRTEGRNPYIRNDINVRYESNRRRGKKVI